MKRHWLAYGLMILTMAGVTLLVLPGCGDEDCAADGDQCVSNSDCCDGSCGPTGTPGVYRCH